MYYSSGGLSSLGWRWESQGRGLLASNLTTAEEDQRTRPQNLRSGLC